MVFLSTPNPATTFSLLTSNERKEEALKQRRSSALSPPYRGLRWEGAVTWRASPSALSHPFSGAVPTSLTMFRGGTWEGGSCEEKDADFAGKPGSPLNGAWRWKGGRMIRSDIILCARHPRVRRCSQSAGIHCTKGCRRYGEEKKPNPG